MTLTTRAGTWQEATKGLRVQAKDGSIWTLERLTLEGIVISVTMAAEAEPGRTVVVHPASYDDPITIVETAPWAVPPEVRADGSVIFDSQTDPALLAEARTQGQEIAAEALAAQVAASNAAPTGFPPLSDAERAAKTPEERAATAKETLARHTAELQARLAKAPAIAAAAVAGVPYVAPMPDVQPEPPSVVELEREAAIGDTVTVGGIPFVKVSDSPFPPETSTAAASVDVAPIQAVGEVWPSPPADDWTEGEMYAHLFLFHGDWATGQTTAKSGKKLLLELHERHQKAHETGHAAGIDHFHRTKEN